MKPTLLKGILLKITLLIMVNLCWYSEAPGALETTTTLAFTANGKLSFFFQEVEIRSLLQLIAKTSGLNFVISDAVKGNITLSLKDVAWQEALDIVMSSHGLTSRRVGNVIFISTLEEMTSNETKKLQSQQDISNIAPLVSRIVQLKYTNAADMATILKGQQSQLLTQRGQVAVDAHTNSLIIKDTSVNVGDVITAISKLDVPARQVAIEARIVNIDCIYEEELGVKFGMSDTTNLSGTFGGANQLRKGTSPANIIPPEERLNFNLPASALTLDQATPGSIALALARVGRILLDLELSALEGEQHAQVIARPHVVTQNQQKAIIQTGEEIPYQEATSSGATSVAFKNAVLSLEIVPQITPDNKIILKIKATEDTRGTNTAVGAVGSVPITIPAINTQSVESDILLNDNETVALGGVYKVISTNKVDRVPFFGNLPVVGYLFRHSSVNDEKHELLIFITPKIINSKLTTAEVCHHCVKPTPIKTQLPYKGEI